MASLAGCSGRSQRLLETACTCMKSRGKARAGVSMLHTSGRADATTATATAPPVDTTAEQAAALPAQIQQLESESGSSSHPADLAGPPLSTEEFQVRERRRRMSLMSSLATVGSSQTRSNTWQPHHSLSRSQTPASLTLSHLLASTAHIGHSTSLGSPKAFPYVVGTRHGVSIIDVRETLTALRRASNLVRSTVENDGIVLFLGGGALKESERVLVKNAEKMGRNGYAAAKWTPGLMTNAKKIYASSTSLINDSVSVQASGDQDRRPRSINATHFLPSLLVLFSPLSTPYALREANALNIPTIALCDTNVDPRQFTYPIPANDDSLRVVELISGVLAEAGKEGLKKREARDKAQQDLDRQYGLQRQFETQDRQRYRRPRA